MSFLFVSLFPYSPFFYLSSCSSRHLPNPPIYQPENRIKGHGHHSGREDRPPRPGYPIQIILRPSFFRPMLWKGRVDVRGLVSSQLENSRSTAQKSFFNIIFPPPQSGLFRSGWTFRHVESNINSHSEFFFHEKSPPHVHDFSNLLSKRGFVF